MIQWFFPSLLSNVLMNEYNVVGKYLLDRLVPLESMENCPEITTEIVAASVTSGVVTIRQPNLVVASSLGILIGLIGCRLLLFRYYAFYGHRSRQQQHKRQVLFPNPNQPVAGSKRSRLHTLKWWSMGFLFFGLMNISALLLHCLLPSPSISASESEASLYYHNVSTRSQLCWMLDCIFTGCSSTFLIIASIFELTKEMKQQQQIIQQYIIQYFGKPFVGIERIIRPFQDYNITSRRILQIYLSYVCMSIMLFKTQYQTTIFLELCYVLPMIIATITVSTWFILQLCSAITGWYMSIALATTKPEANENAVLENKKKNDDYNSTDVVNIVNNNNNGQHSPRHNDCNGVSNSLGFSTIASPRNTLPRFSSFLIYSIGGIISVSGILIEANQCRDRDNDRIGRSMMEDAATNIIFNDKFDWISASAYVFYGIDVAFVGILLLLLLLSRDCEPTLVAR